ncbi:MAG: uncharacterized protein PWP65_1456 [Clostridia bacterium]|nr:uncharacterized protein [Clostridia bacterium]
MGANTGKGAVYAALKQGRVIVEHPPDGPYPLVIPGKGVKLKLNGEERNGPVPVTSSDEVIVETLKEEIPGSWRVEITPDLMKAVLKIKPREVIEYNLKDLPPARQLYLEATEKREQFIPFTLEELLHELRRLKIILRGIDWEALNRILLNPEEGEIVLVQGTPPQPSKDGWVEFLFNPAEKVKVELPEEGNVDLRQRFIFTSVQPGAVLARKHPAQPGKPGVDIMGNVVLPPPPKDVLLEAGEGTTLLKDGQEVVANRPGRPVAIRGQGKVRVKIVNTLNHVGDVDSSSGHISFAGDVFISGSVLEGMRVEAGENVAIAGMVSEAIIKAQKSVSLGG